MDGVLPILSRWIHVLTACIAIGGTFFMLVVLPRGLQLIEGQTRTNVFLRIRAAFKRVIHAAILLLLISGTYNAMLVWPRYAPMKGLGHGLFGMHLLLALIVFGLALYATAGKEPPAKHRGLMKLNMVLLLLVVLAASTLKWARERATAARSTPENVAQVTRD